MTDLTSADYDFAFAKSASVVAQHLQTSYMPGLDVSNYHTYEWIAIRPHPIPTVDALIRELIDSQLSAKGLTTTKNNADLKVGYKAAIAENQYWDTVSFSDNGDLVPQRIMLTLGTLGIDIRDRRLDRIIWTGHVTKALDTGSTEQKKIANLDKAIRELLDNFPKR